MKLKVWIFTTCVTIYSCKNPPQKSEVKFDSSMSSMLKIDEFDAKQIEEICSKSPMFVFIGNAEQALGIGKEGEIFNPELVKSQIDKAKTDLIQMLSKRPNKCDEYDKTRADRKQNYAMGLFITDGPSISDSTIEAVWYKYDASASKENGLEYSKKWVKDTNKSFSWKYDKGVFTKIMDKAYSPFELHLPTDIGPIVKFFMEQKPMIEVEDPADSSKKILAENVNFKFNQMIYMIKSHGGKYYELSKASGEEGSKIAANAMFKALNGTPDESAIRHAFLFDRNKAGSPRNSMVSDVYVPKGKRADTCKMLRDRVDSSLEVKVRGLCQACGPALKEEANKGVFSKCFDTAGKSPEEIKKDPLLSWGGDDTLSWGGDDTLSLGGDDTLSWGGDDTLGSAKSMGFSGSIGESFPTSLKVAAGVSYSSTKSEIAGMSRLSLPMLGGSNTPGMLVLDSCFGDESIISEAFTLADKTQPVVVVFNPQPMALAAFNYGAFDYFQLLAYPYVQAASAQGLPGAAAWTNKAREIKTKMDGHISRVGLSGSESPKADEKYNKGNKKFREIKTIVIQGKA